MTTNPDNGKRRDMAACMCLENLVTVLLNDAWAGGGGGTKQNKTKKVTT
jgi:hypothetical protein